MDLSPAVRASMIPEVRIQGLILFGLCRSIAAGFLGLNAKRGRCGRALDRDRVGTQFDTDEKQSREYRRSCIREQRDLTLEILAGDLSRTSVHNQTTLRG